MNYIHNLNIICFVANTVMLLYFLNGICQ